MDHAKAASQDREPATRDTKRPTDSAYGEANGPQLGWEQLGNRALTRLATSGAVTGRSLPTLEHLGNRALIRLFKSRGASRRVQPRLVVGPADSPDEREAETFADTISSGAPSPAAAAAAPGSLPPPPADGNQGKLDELHLARRGEGEAAAPGGSAIDAAERAVTGAGEPLASGIRGDLERSAGTDLSHVRVHTGSDAARASKQLGALAFTVGDDIAFAQGQYRPHAPDGRHLIAHEIAHTLQQSPRLKAFRPTGGRPLLQLWRWPWQHVPTTNAERIRLGVAGDTDAIAEITDFSSASEAQRLTMIDHLTRQFWFWSEDSAALVRIWNSFGSEFARVAGQNALRWRNSTNKNSSLWTAIPEAQRVRDAFAPDVRAQALANLATNRTYANETMERLGLPRTAQQPAAPMTDAQAGQIARLQVAAEGLAKLQRAQEIAREAFVGFQPVLRASIDDTPAYRRVHFDPDAPPQMTELPGGTLELWNDQSEGFVHFGPYGPNAPGLVTGSDAEDFLASQAYRRQLTAITPYQPLKARYDEVTAAIAAHLAAFPELYAISVQGSSQVSGRLANAQTPEEARGVLAEAFRTLLGNIDRTQQRIDDNSLDVLDLTPLHQRMYASQGPGASGILWSEPFPRSVGELLTLNHNIDRAVRRLILQSVTQLAFVFAPIAGPLAVPLLLAGTVAAGVNAVESYQRFIALSQAQGAGALPGTQLVTPGAVDEARMASEADTLAFGIAVMVLGASAAAAAIRGFRAVQQARLAARRAQILERVGSPTRVTTGLAPFNPRPNEIPYGIPESEQQVVRPGRPLDFNRLNPSRRYLWVVDEEGNFRVADEGQGTRFPARGRLPPGHPSAGETPLKHGDLTPGPGGQARGVARIGGEMHPELDANGRPTGRWRMDLESSYSYPNTRFDQAGATGANLNATIDLLGTTGTDTSRLVAAP